MCTHTVHIHKIQIAHVQDMLHTRAIVYLEAGLTHWFTIGTHTVHIHKIQIAHVQDILHTCTILYLEAGHTHWVIIEVLVCGRFRRSSASSSE